MEFQVASQRIWLEDGEGRQVAFVSFPARSDRVVEIVSTVVSPPFRGQGVAGLLLETLAQQLRTQGKQAIPVCSYAVSWFSQHPEQQDLLWKSTP